MTFAFSLITVGSILLFAGVRNRKVTDILRGVTSPVADDLTSVPSSIDASFVTSAAKGILSPTGASGLTNFEGEQVCTWIANELKIARKNGWTGHVTDGFRSEADQERVCATGVTPCAKPGTSNHEGKRYPKCAVDVDDAAGLSKHLRKGSPLKWTGKSIGDEPHFSSGLNGV